MIKITLEMDVPTAGAVKTAIVNELRRFLDMERHTHLPEIADAIQQRLQILKAVNDYLRNELRK